MQRQAEDIARYGLNEKDIVIGISASGGADYVVGALLYANSVGACSVSISSNSDTPIEHAAKLHIVVDTGAEVITGSTRMKSGTAQKLVLNMISTAAMVKTGKVYENLMINLRPGNRKLKLRMIGIVSEIAGCDAENSEKLLDANGWNIRKAVEEEMKNDLRSDRRSLQSVDKPQSLLFRRLYCIFCFSADMRGGKTLVSEKPQNIAVFQGHWGGIGGDRAQSENL